MSGFSLNPMSQGMASRDRRPKLISSQIAQLDSRVTRIEDSMNIALDLLRRIEAKCGHGGHEGHEGHGGHHTSLAAPSLLPAPPALAAPISDASSVASSVVADSDLTF